MAGRDRGTPLTIDVPNSRPVVRDEPAAANSGHYTVDELARIVGMSPRNIRSHQARKLLAAPLRNGRAAYYDDAHVRRLEMIKSLQRQGFNLVSIEAILGVRTSDPGNRALVTMLRQLAEEKPSLLYALGRHSVVGRDEDGSVQLVRPRVLRSALELRRVGVRTESALQVLVELMDAVRALAEELVEAAGGRVLSLTPDAAFWQAKSWEDVDRLTVTLTQGIVTVLTEAFRVAVENCSETTVSALVATRAGTDLSFETMETVDNG
jgi:DNA-binding transcriptional MerR regulator